MSLRVGCFIIGILGLMDTILFVGLRLSLLNIIGIGCSSALICGVVKRNRDFFWPYLILKLYIAFALAMVLSLGMIATPILAFSIVDVALFALTIMWNCIFFWIVYSHSVELREMEIMDDKVPSVQTA